MRDRGDHAPAPVIGSAASGPAMKPTAGPLWRNAAARPSVRFSPYRLRTGGNSVLWGNRGRFGWNSGPFAGPDHRQRRMGSPMDPAAQPQITALLSAFMPAARTISPGVACPRADHSRDQSHAAGSVPDRSSGSPPPSHVTSNVPTAVCISDISIGDACDVSIAGFYRALAQKAGSVNVAWFRLLSALVG